MAETIDTFETMLANFDVKAPESEQNFIKIVKTLKYLIDTSESTSLDRLETMAIKFSRNLDFLIKKEPQFSKFETLCTQTLSSMNA